MERTSQKTQRVVVKSEGVTPSERYLKQLCDRSFLSLWSYPGVYRDQGRNSRGDGKEVCDLLVVFEDHIIIFSDKECELVEGSDLELNWRRWYRKAIEKSARQVWGAERWIREHESKLFLDRKCTQEFPLMLPPADQAKVHRIVVAHGAARACRRHLGGSGSLMLEPNLIGPGAPFIVGQVDPSKGFVHVFDDTSLDIVLTSLDTVSDFVKYLTKKEEFILSGSLSWAAGEEELLAFYLKNINKSGQHDFVLPKKVEFVSIDEGLWLQFSTHAQRKAQAEANRISYAWDALIEHFAKHILEGTSHYNSHVQIADRERIFRFLAREDRTRRRLLAEALLGIMEQTPTNMRGVRIVRPSYPDDPHYVFLILPKGALEEAEYRLARRQYLQASCMITKLICPEAHAVLGIATDAGMQIARSEDALYLDTREWSEEMNVIARELQKELGLLVDLKEFRCVEKEYPDWQKPARRGNRRSRRAAAAKARKGKAFSAKRRWPQ